ncbi:MAG: TatD family hydrolase [Treponema sp.]|jgi:TatD DNase family protein|nr:TatD family hydrolase [Treponema sp.]
MMTDAHCHPFDLLEHLPGAEAERLEYRVACAGNSWNLKQFEHLESMALKASAAGAPPLVRCFAVHPQVPASIEHTGPGKGAVSEGLELLAALAAGGRLEVVGETGFDLFNEAFRKTEKIQDEIFALHLETALRYRLPLILHVRRAMHKIFPFSRELKKLPAVVFHSWPGTLGEGESLIRRGVNVFFSFGAALVNNHREAQRCCAALPAERLLLETDAPWQPLRGKTFSSWADLPVILNAAAELRKGGPGGTAQELEAVTERNFLSAFGAKL